MNSLFTSIDIETTGLDENTCQTIQIGAVIDDWLNPMDRPHEFEELVHYPTYKGEPYALAMHKGLFSLLAAPALNPCYGDTILRRLLYWMQGFGAYDSKGKATIAGKNFGMFDDRFLRKLPDYHDLNLAYRVIDPANLFWIPWKDEQLPGLKTCLERAGLPAQVEHTALADAKAVSKLVQVAAARI